MRARILASPYSTLGSLKGVMDLTCQGTRHTPLALPSAGPSRLEPRHTYRYSADFSWGASAARLPSFWGILTLEYLLAGEYHTGTCTLDHSRRIRS